MNQPDTSPSAPAPRRKPQPYVHAVGPRLYILLISVFASFALLAATGVYMFAVRAMDMSANDPNITYTTPFALWMILFHIVLGVVMTVPFLAFGVIHLITARTRPNRVAVRLGIMVFVAGIVVVASGFMLVQTDALPQLPTGSFARWLVYGLHVIVPVVAIFLYILHRKAGPMIKWRWGVVWGGITAAVILGMIFFHSHDPRTFYVLYSSEGDKYFEPSKMRNAGLKLIPYKAMLMDTYCMKCHEDIYNDHIHSAHKFSSLNNDAYLFSVRETRRRMGARASRWCAGCHDVVPFASGTFESPFNDDRFDPARDVDRLKMFLEVEAILDTDLTERTYTGLLTQFLNKQEKEDPYFDAEKHKKSALEALKEFGDQQPDLNPRTHPVAGASITCVVCHGITHVNSRSGNGDYIIEEPLHYPFAYSENPVLQWINNQLVKAKPDFHKKTFLKPFHRDREKFCSTCHKVGLPLEVNHYKEFLRGQNHSDSYYLSGVSGHGVRSFYYPPKSKRCADCHMPLKPSLDFGARDFDGSGIRKIHDHLFPGANTGVPGMLRYPGWEKVVERQRHFLLKGADGKSPTMRVDIFGLKKLTEENPGVFAPLIDDQPLRPNLPKLQRGGNYMVEVVVRTLNVGHHFTQGTVDSNEVWVEAKATSGGRLLGISGGMDGGEDKGTVDEWSHFLNALVLDRHGKRIDRRNAQDIFTPLYSNQIPPGAGQIVHYKLKIPPDIKEPVKLEVRVRYRKFDYKYMSLVHGGKNIPQLPIIDLCEDQVILPVAGVAENVPKQQSHIPEKIRWQRWNDYGIGCFLEGRDPTGRMSPELGQAERAFKKLLGPEFAKWPVAKAHGYLNLARVYFAYGSQNIKKGNETGYLDKAAESLQKALDNKPPAPWWTVAWFSGLVNLERGEVDAAIETFQKILDPANQPRKRNFDFTKDWVVINALGKSYYSRALQEVGDASVKERERYFQLAIRQFNKTLEYDAENVVAHDFLHRCYERLAGAEKLHWKEPVDLNEDETKLRRLVTRLTEKDQPKNERIQAGKELLPLLKKAKHQYRPLAVVALRDRCLQAARATKEPWVWLAIAPVMAEMDRLLLNELTKCGDTFAGERATQPARLGVAAEILAILDQLQQHPPRADVYLAGKATRHELIGLLPPPRLLKLQALDKKIGHMFEHKDRQLREAASSILSGIHSTMHKIYKQDDTAERVKQIYRANHPAAARASQPPVIYELKAARN